MQLLEDCNYNVNLLSETEYLSLAISIVGVPGLAAYNHKTISRLACFMVKEINVTSATLQDILLDIQSYKKAILQNRATIDYLLLQHGIGCSAFSGMCCFNLSDHSQGIKDKMVQLEEMIKHIKQDANQGWWDWLFSWIPDFGQIRYVLGVVFAIIAIMICLCCCVQCIPSLLSTCQSFTEKRVRSTSYYTPVLTGEMNNTPPRPEDYSPEAYMEYLWTYRQKRGKENHIIWI